MRNFRSLRLSDVCLKTWYILTSTNTCWYSWILWQNFVHSCNITIFIKFDEYHLKFFFINLFAPDAPASSYANSFFEWHSKKHKPSFQRWARGHHSLNNRKIPHYLNKRRFLHKCACVGGKERMCEREGEGAEIWSMPFRFSTQRGWEGVKRGVRGVGGLGAAGKQYGD